jgi:uncharacterized membrane protein YeaQ/YmgE (transglycosylase-associated protein family)
MDTHSILAWILIGAIAGWLAGTVIKGGGYGLIGDIVVGIIGAFIGGWLAGQLGIAVSAGLIASILTATVGAIVLLLIVRLIRRA